jgi:hypothetical protein
MKNILKDADRQSMSYKVDEFQVFSYISEILKT